MIYIELCLLLLILSLIFQFDCQSRTLSSIQHGTRTKKIEFSSIISYQSEASTQFFFSFLRHLCFCSFLLCSYGGEVCSGMCGIGQTVLI